MKKNLLIFALLLCTTGISYADGITTNPDIVPVQETEIQNQLNKTTFENFDKNKKFNESLKRNQDKNKINYDKTIKNNKYKNGDRFNPSFNRKGEVQNKIIQHDRFKKGHRDYSINTFNNKPHRFSHHIRHTHKIYRPEPRKLQKAHRPQINNYKRHSNNIRKIRTKRA